MNAIRSTLIHSTLALALTVGAVGAGEPSVVQSPLYQFPLPGKWKHLQPPAEGVDVSLSTSEVTTLPRLTIKPVSASGTGSAQVLAAVRGVVDAPEFAAMGKIVSEKPCTLLIGGQPGAGFLLVRDNGQGTIVSQFVLGVAGEAPIVHVANVLVAGGDQLLPDEFDAALRAIAIKGLPDVSPPKCVGGPQGIYHLQPPAGWVTRPSDIPAKADVLLDATVAPQARAKQPVVFLYKDVELGDLLSARESIAKQEQGTRTMWTSLGGAESLRVARYDTRSQRMEWSYYIAINQRTVRIAIMQPSPGPMAEPPGQITAILETINP